MSARRRMLIEHDTTSQKLLFFQRNIQTTRHSLFQKQQSNRTRRTKKEQVERAGGHQEDRFGKQQRGGHERSEVTLFSDATIKRHDFPFLKKKQSNKSTIKRRRGQARRMVAATRMKAMRCISFEHYRNETT